MSTLNGIPVAAGILGNLKIPTVSKNPWIDLGVKVGIVAGAGYLTFIALREAGIIPDKRGANEDAKATKTALEQLAEQGVVPNYPDIQYRQWADQAYQAMRNSSVAENEESVVEIAEYMLNDADVLKWAQEYGTRQHYYFGAPDGAPITLFEAFAVDLKDSRRQSINEHWVSKNISIRA